MARKTPRPQATRQEVLECVHQKCPECTHNMWSDYKNYRTITTMTDVVHLTLKVRRCQNENCERYHEPYRPETEGQWALPGHEFGLDVIATIGNKRYREHRTVGELHKQLEAQGVIISERTVTNLLDRYDELVAVSLRESKRLQRVLRQQGQVILAIDGLQPDVGHEVLWVIRDCVSGEVLLARSLLSAARDDLASLLEEVKESLPVPVVGIVSDGQRSLRQAIAQVFPDVPHGLCHFHYLREAGRLIYEADRGAKKELKKRVRGVRILEREVAEKEDELSCVIHDYCQAVRSALTDDGRPPLIASGLRLRARLKAITDSLARVEEKRKLPPALVKLKTMLVKGLAETSSFWAPIQTAFDWLHAAAHLLKNEAELAAYQVRRRFIGLVGAMTRWRAKVGELVPAVDHFLKVTRSYWSGLFHCYDVPDLPRTNNDLEHLFGSQRYHERRTTGRKSASPSLVIRGAVRIVARLVTSLRPLSAADLQPESVADWQSLREELAQQRHQRILQRRFRQDPEAYLTNLETRLDQLVLPL